MKNQIKSGLYVVATPIGNAEDITLRALNTLKTADIIACEDTRVTGKLLSILGIDTPMLSYHEHNADKVRPVLIEKIAKGQTVALVSDAGTPLVSDPGFKLVRDCVEEGLYVTALPGASSVINALVLSALPTNSFMFAGFLPPKSGQRKKALSKLKDIPSTLIFFESAKRLKSSLADMAEVLGQRKAAVAREMTKMFEETRRATLKELYEQYESEATPKGEIVIVINPPDEKACEFSEEEIDDMINEALETMRAKDASVHVAEKTGKPKKEIYKRIIEIKNG